MIKILKIYESALKSWIFRFDQKPIIVFKCFIMFKKRDNS